MRAILLASVLGMAIAGAGAATVAPQAMFLFVGEDLEGHVVSFLHDGAPDHQTSCGGMAPVVTDCNNGQHTPANGPASYLHGFLFVPTATIPGVGAVGYTGSLVSTVSDGIDTRVFTCNVWNNAVALPGVGSPAGLAGCAGVGIKPSTTFTQACNSNMPGNQLLGGLANVPGGVGNWLCYVTGNNGYPAP
ncbi:MAG TPA: hypothetical protein VGR28_10320 [Candidatus Thermoplasmatota archaeon]|jgi:hypothetical protein|nr:hypothetical protein [Candidatus Thermoplasmatota archaeon]